jgi:hypothetical protein
LDGGACVFEKKCRQKSESVNLKRKKTDGKNIFNKNGGKKRRRRDATCVNFRGQQRLQDVAESINLLEADYF